MISNHSFIQSSSSRSGIGEITYRFKSAGILQYIDDSNFPPTVLPSPENKEIVGDVCFIIHTVHTKYESKIWYTHCMWVDKISGLDSSQFYHVGSTLDRYKLLKMLSSKGAVEPAGVV